ncbi:unnamed protein product, partial [Rotaria sp. Silwood1]
ETTNNFMSKKGLTEEELEKLIRDGDPGFCALGARAFDVVEGDGFKNLAKILFGVGRCSNTSSIEITDLLPHPTTICRNITRLYEEYKIELIDICEQLTSFCLIVDQCTEAHTD